ncbi:hypothetical protein DFP72DRAFT_233645 [Ephemerocybe angulata]|uniref:F-box domain-containing protein n=1 Tax=Ephemerocybe angulata TaxID=980116 RepID=A0A8H6M780_9AGAR|nr:hypothetical protein DFP72DRAFT_233645 [Tulosesus angulatus]
MSWKREFSTAVKHFRTGDLELALESFNQAIDNGAKKEYAVYDSRSAVLEKLGRRKDALKDAKTTIELAPAQWQGYARAAKLFLQMRKFDSATKMIDAALKRLKGDETKRRDELSTLKNDIAVAEEDYIRRTTNHWTHLQFELFADIAQMLVDEDIKHLIPLSHVCKDWRRVVEDRPGLWSTLVIGRARPWAKAERWIKHSKGVIHSLTVPYESHERGKWDGDGLSGIRWDQLRAFKAEHWNLCSHLKRSASSLAVLTSLTRYDYTNEVRTPQIPPFHASWPVQHPRTRPQSSSPSLSLTSWREALSHFPSQDCRSHQVVSSSLGA